MNQQERRKWLLDSLLKERIRYGQAAVPSSEMEQKQLLRALVNVRPPAPVSDEFLRVQDAYLQEELREKGITDIEDLQPVEDGIYLWQGDITTLRCGAIVNAANSGMTGCYVPGHSCIDNAIHTYAGVQLRLECDRIMREQGHEEASGQAKITPAFNLPCDHVIHTVGPIVQGALTEEDERLLASCYRSCLQVALENGVASIASCCISTGVFRFPAGRAAEIAVRTVRDFRRGHRGRIQVLFNVFKDSDLEIYSGLLGDGGQNT
ncbi:MAG: protein-ADP-ribose hydrolase [Anaerovoracaceae bacterium]|jgi:O-acetyl-ADP-ribose deacetylase (regulator of RNase III)